MSLVYLIIERMKDLPPLELICEQCQQPFNPVFTNVYQLSPKYIWLCSDECRRIRGRERERGYYIKNIEIRGRRKRPDRKGTAKKTRLRLLEILDKRLYCIKCGALTNLHIHHKNSEDAKEDRVRFAGGLHMYGYYIKHQEEALRKLQILCLDCNIAKNRKYK